ncbi:MAG TPA: hypothetical protein VGV61_16930 [Thermoanaerobaculia bacterium]|nr:hypothetical protein [Thermoanaerobaculia bacterium]
MSAARFRLALRAVACALVPLLLPLAEASAALLAPTPHACVVVMHCCKTGFCPLQKAAHGQPAWPTWESCANDTPTRATTAPARPPATLCVALALMPPTGVAPLRAECQLLSSTDPPLPDSPPPRATGASPASFVP